MMLVPTNLACAGAKGSVARAADSRTAVGIVANETAFGSASSNNTEADSV